MKAVTLHQPYASLIAIEAKTIETRTWPAPKSLIGQRIAIHAAKKPVRSIYDYGDGTYSAKTLPPGFEHTQDHCWEWIENPNFGGEGRWYWTAPLGAVVATARLAACIPMFDTWDIDNICDTDHCIQLSRSPYTGDIETYYEWEPGSGEHGYRNGGLGDEDQIKFGNFEPGNWGWMLEDIEALADPIPCKGYQRVWNLPDEAVARIIEPDQQ